MIKTIAMVAGNWSSWWQWWRWQQEGLLGLPVLLIVPAGFVSVVVVSCVPVRGGGGVAVVVISVQRCLGCHEVLVAVLTVVV